MIEIIKPTFYWPEYTIRNFPFICQHIERCGRICYKSEDRITDKSADKFLQQIIKSGHESVLEHVSLTAIIICSRACSHQLVRHRIAAYSQESQRYCNYGKIDSLKVICPLSINVFVGEYINYGRMIRQNNKTIDLNELQTRWIHHINEAYKEYKKELSEGMKSEDARYVLPNATKTELAVTFNIRQWRHVFKERALNSHAQWEIRSIFSSILNDLKIRLPILFGDL